MSRQAWINTMVMAVAVMLSLSGTAFADWGEDEHRGYGRGSTLPAVNSDLYASECGACHFAYQPGWLPARSWRKIMGTLDRHFDENAELDRAAVNAITRYLVAEAADAKPNRKSRKILRSIGASEAPMRISTLRYMIRKHDEIPERMISGNAKVGSRANCAACHTQAAAGNFNEHGVRIPGYGYWED